MRRFTGRLLSWFRSLEIVADDPGIESDWTDRAELARSQRLRRADAARAQVAHTPARAKRAQRPL